jgi:hypothetical protein
MIFLKKFQEKRLLLTFFSLFRNLGNYESNPYRADVVNIDERTPENLLLDL